MKVGVSLFALFVLTAGATPAASVPAVNISWDNCTGPTDRKLQQGQPASIYASVLGHNQPHKAYQVQLRLYSTTGIYPDAWRFELGGCEGPTHLIMDHLAPAEVAAACPSFQGTLPSFQLKDFTYDPSSGRAYTFVACAYPNGGLGNTQQVNPATRYFLARWRFDGVLWAEGSTVPGVTCGRVDASMCISSSSLTSNAASWVNLSDQEIPFGFQNEAISVLSLGGGTYGCPFGSPAVNRTWGAIKSQYH